MNRFREAFTLVEMVVSLGASVIVVGGLLVSSVTLQKTLFENEQQVEIRSNQRRVLDYLGREMRRAISIVSKDGSGLPVSVAGQSILLSSETPLIFTLPGYYGSNDPSAAEFDQPLPVITTADEVAYGNEDGAAPSVLVRIAKTFVEEEDCVCFVRKEADASQVIVRAAEALHVTAHFSPDGRTCRMEATVRVQLRNRMQTISTYDTVLLRNGDHLEP